ncbi:short-chain dehydrogenase [Mycobacterium lepromatosis]|nr:short-chain dehydrogenase [Mycobacterium lepromatosis]
MNRLGRPEELTGLYVYLTGEVSSYVTGSDIVINGRYNCPYSHKAQLTNEARTAKARGIQGRCPVCGLPLYLTEDATLDTGLRAVSNTIMPSSSLSI